MEVLQLHKQLQKLQICENNVHKQAIVADLKCQLIVSLEECAYSVNQSSTNASMLNVEKKTSSQSFTAKDVRKLFSQSLETQLDAILLNPVEVAS